MIREAFGAESRRLSEVVARLDDAAFTRPTPCDSWTVADLVYHVRMTMGRLPGMLAAPDPAGADLVTAAGYYRGGQRFSADTNAERIRSAQRGAAGLAGAVARARDFDEARRRAWGALRDAPPGRVVLTRHGDRMLLAEFLRTRVLELAVHGLDLAAGLDRAPWMTATAAGVTGDLLLPAADAARLRSGTGWDQVTLIAGLTGRRPLTPAETGLVQSAGVGWLALG
ncbi:MAG: maleylpyruvate isomerase N-terminal domain-containing protein [Streptosporangiaceae bacterium]